MRPLKRKNAALKRANASLKAASAFFRAKLDRHGLWYQSPHSGVAISTRSMLRQHRNLNLESLRTPQGRLIRTRVLAATLQKWGDRGNQPGCASQMASRTPDMPRLSRRSRS